MVLFKAIVRHIAAHDITGQEASWFLSEQRVRLRRLAKLGVAGHQPALATYVQTPDEEKDRIAQSIIAQKAGNHVKKASRSTASSPKRSR